GSWSILTAVYHCLGHVTAPVAEKCSLIRARGASAQLRIAAFVSVVGSLSLRRRSSVRVPYDSLPPAGAALRALDRKQRVRSDAAAEARLRLLASAPSPPKRPAARYVKIPAVYGAAHWAALERRRADLDSGV